MKNKKVVIDVEVSEECECKKHKSYAKSIVDTIFSSINGIFMFLALVVFLLLGFIGGYWSKAWILFFVPEIISSIVKAIKEKRMCRVNITFICCAIYFFVCMVYPGTEAKIWHPMWVIFLLIPLWYIFFSKVDKNYHKDDVKCHCGHCHCNEDNDD